MTKKIINIIITLLFGALWYYITLPAINLNNISFYMFITVLIIVYNTVNLISKSNQVELIRKGRNVSYELPVLIKYSLFAITGIWAGIFTINFIASPLFNAESYQQRIEVDENGEFATDIAEVNFDQLPLLDKKSSIVLGDRIMGQVNDLVSQFKVSNIYTQINYNNKIIRVTPLEYADAIKWFTNRSAGIPGYITVDSVTGEANLIKLEKKMKYSESALFNENLKRKLRFKYPTLNFGKISFEINNEGNPFYIIPTIKFTAVNLKAQVTGVIIFDPTTGESTRYENDDIPNWVDIAYSADLVIEQLDDWGTYKNGFLNSVFGQKNVVNTTEGYNYLAMNDDIYLYTGITSVISDESNLGFILTNMRTGKTVYYNVPGAEEYSAMSSAEGQVQDMGYTSTFPLLINLNGKPTYLVSLKDSSGLVKMYGFVDVKDYQKVVVTDASEGIEKAKENYLKNNKKDISDDELIIKEIKIEKISTAIIDGNTYYYIENNKEKYKISINLSDNLPFVTVGDTIKVGYFVTDKQVIDVEKIYDLT